MPPSLRNPRYFHPVPSNYEYALNAEETLKEIMRTKELWHPNRDQNLHLKEMYPDNWGMT